MTLTSLLRLTSCAAIAALALLTASKSRPDPSPPITARPAVLGGVFLDGEPVRWDIKSAGDAVRWQVTDFEDAPVASGTAANGSLTIPLRRHGYFALHLTVEKAGRKTSEQDATFAILSPAPKLGTASPFGVMTHFAQGWNQDIIPLIARLGAGEDRDEQYWNAVEKMPGQFVYPPSFESYMTRLGQNGIASLTPLTFENGHYDGGQTPYTQAGFDGYARYGQEVVGHYGPQIRAVEIWNEYNGSFCKGPATQDRAGTYVKMLKTAYPALKRTRPDVLVLGCDTAGIPLPFLEKIFAAGGLQYMDGVSVHPYRYGSAPEGFENEIAGLETLIRKYNGGKPKPIWVTEMGWFLKKSQAPGDLTITEAEQAKFAVRGDCLLLSAGVQKMFWYLFRDYNEFATMGLVRDERDPLGRYAPKPAYVAFAVMARQLAGARFVRREPAADGVYSLLFGRSGEEIRVLWATTPTPLTVGVKSALSQTDLMGETQALTPAEGTLRLALTDAPVYLHGVVTLPPPPPAVKRVVLADSRRDFSDTQGRNGWQYGFWDGTGTYHFQPLPKYQVTDFKREWTGPSPYLEVTADEQHPGAADGRPVWSIRRWVSPIAGQIRIQGEVGHGTEGDGVNVHVLADGVSLYQQKFGGGAAVAGKIDLLVPVHVGSTVDFAVDPGPGTNIDYDATQFTVTILRPGQL